MEGQGNADEIPGTPWVCTAESVGRLWPVESRGNPKVTLGSPHSLTRDTGSDEIRGKQVKSGHQQGEPPLLLTAPCLLHLGGPQPTRLLFQRLRVTLTLTMYRLYVCPVGLSPTVVQSRDLSSRPCKRPGAVSTCMTEAIAVARNPLRI